MANEQWKRRITDQGEVVVFEREGTPEGGWARSEWPHPLLTLDYDQHDQLIGLEAVGPLAAALSGESAATR